MLRYAAALSLAVLLTCTAIALAASQKKAAEASYENATPVDTSATVLAPVISPNPPFVVPAPQKRHPPFNWFAWETFVALNWPAATDPETGLPVRGQADTGKKLGDAGIRVWETYKTDWETFGTGSALPQPTSWNSWDVKSGMGPCAAYADSGEQKAQTVIIKMDEFDESNPGPLIDANGNYVHYEVRLNQAEYDAILNHRWFLAENLPLQVTFPSSTSSPARHGAIEVKAAWRVLIPGKDDFSRYYTIKATVLDPGNPPVCHNAIMGLIGLHLAIKTVPFKEWVWATFEQEDNVPEGTFNADIHYSLNNGTPDPPTNVNGFNYPPNGSQSQMKGPSQLRRNQPLPADSPVQVTRYTPIDPSITKTNEAFHKVLTGTVWIHYNLVADQWPKKPAAFNPRLPYPIGSGTPSPNDHVANTSTDAYFQNAPAAGGFGNSCMQCHFRAASTDFNWTLAKGAFRPPTDAATRGVPTSVHAQEKQRAALLNLLRMSMQQRFGSSSPQQP